MNLGELLEKSSEYKKSVTGNNSKYRAKQRSQDRRDNSPIVGQRLCCNFGEEKIEPVGPFLVNSYKPKIDAWEAIDTKTSFQFDGKPLNNGAIGTGDILPGYPNNPYGGLLNPKASRTVDNKKDAVKNKTVKVRISIGYTGKR